MIEIEIEIEIEEDDRMRTGGALRYFPSLHLMSENTCATTFE